MLCHYHHVQMGMLSVCCDFSSRASSIVKQQPAVVADLPSSLPTAQRPSSVIPIAFTTDSADSVPATSSVAVTQSTSVDSRPTADMPSSVDSVAVTEVDSTQDVSVTSSTSSQGGASSLLAQLSYKQPSIDLLRRRREADTSTVTQSSQGPTHLLSSATQAALEKLASTPRRCVTAVYIFYIRHFSFRFKFDIFVSISIAFIVHF